MQKHFFLVLLLATGIAKLEAAFSFTAPALVWFGARVVDGAFGPIGIATDGTEKKRAINYAPLSGLLRAPIVIAGAIVTQTFGTLVDRMLKHNTNLTYARGSGYVLAGMLCCTLYQLNHQCSHKPKDKNLFKNSKWHMLAGTTGGVILWGFGCYMKKI